MKEDSGVKEGTSGYRLVVVFEIGLWQGSLKKDRVVRKEDSDV